MKEKVDSPLYIAYVQLISDFNNISKQSQIFMKASTARHVKDCAFIYKMLLSPFHMLVTYLHNTCLPVFESVEYVLSLAIQAAHSE